MPRPYNYRSIIPFNFNDPMNVIWHNDVCVHIYAVKMSWYLQPYLLNHLPHLVQHHLTINPLAKQGASPLGDDRDEIGTIL